MSKAVTLPWPLKELSPNFRGHWSAISKAKASYRKACCVLALEAGFRQAFIKPVSVHLHFVPPDRRSRDWDNLIASMKAGLDGLADAMGVDDKHWRISFTVGEGPGGFVRVEADSAALIG